MNKNYVKLLCVLLVAAMMATALLSCKPEEPKPTEPEKETQAAEIGTEAAETEPEETEIIIETEPEVPAPEPGSITYEEYMALEVEVQQAYYEKFETPDDFFAWLNAAKAEQQAATEPQPTVDTEGTENAEGTENTEGEEPTTPAGDIFIDDENVEDWE